MLLVGHLLVGRGNVINVFGLWLRSFGLLFRVPIGDQGKIGCSAAASIPLTLIRRYSTLEEAGCFMPLGNLIIAEVAAGCLFRFSVL